METPNNLNLSSDIVAEIKKLTPKSDATYVNCILPLGSILWSDEKPEGFPIIGSAKDTEQILRLFGIRIEYWNTGRMNPEDQEFWENAKAQFPHWPLFQRLDSDESRKAHQLAQQQAEYEIDALSHSFKKKKWWQFWKR